MKEAQKHSQCLTVFYWKQSAEQNIKQTDVLIIDLSVITFTETLAETQ